MCYVGMRPNLISGIGYATYDDGISETEGVDYPVSSLGLVP